MIGISFCSLWHLLVPSFPIAKTEEMWNVPFPLFCFLRLVYSFTGCWQWCQSTFPVERSATHKTKQSKSSRGANTSYSWLVSYPPQVFLQKNWERQKSEREVASVETFGFLPIRWLVTCEYVSIRKLFPYLWFSPKPFYILYVVISCMRFLCSWGHSNDLTNPVRRASEQGPCDLQHGWSSAIKFQAPCACPACTSWGTQHEWDSVPAFEESSG